MLLSLPKINEVDNNRFPLGIGYLIASLKNAHEVAAYHFSNSSYALKEIDGKVISFKPDIVGLTCNTFNRGAVKEMIRQLKFINRGMKIVVGGIHAGTIWCRYSCDWRGRKNFSRVVLCFGK